MLRALIKAKIDNVKTVKVGCSKRTGGRTNKDAKLKTICETFGYSSSAFKHWKAGKQGVGRQRLYALLYALDDEVLNILNEEFKDE